MSELKGCGKYINARMGITCGNPNYGCPLCDECEEADLKGGGESCRQ